MVHLTTKMGFGRSHQPAGNNWGDFIPRKEAILYRKNFVFQGVGSEKMADVKTGENGGHNTQTPIF